MIQHVVAFRFRGATISERADQAATATGVLSVMAGQVPGLLDLKIRADLGVDSAHWDLVLISRHDSIEALQVYQDHPLHRSAKSRIDEIVLHRAIVDSDLGIGGEVRR